MFGSQRKSRQRSPRSSRPDSNNQNQPSEPIDEGVELRQALDSALRSLAARSQSVSEIRAKLRTKGFKPNIVAQTVARLKELKFLDDRRVAEHYAAALVREKAVGRVRAERELKARRVDPRVVAPALDTAYQETSEFAVLERLLDRKMRSLRLPLTHPRLYALCASLRRRGFRSDDIMKVVRARPALAPVADDLDFESLDEQTEL